MTREEGFNSKVSNSNLKIYMKQSTLCLLIKNNREDRELPKVLEGKKLTGDFFFKKGEIIAKHNIKIVEEL